MMPDVSEADFQRAVIDLAKLRGWRHYHTHDSRRSDPGFPDLTLVRGDQLVLAELKSEKGRVRPEQKAWIQALAPVMAATDGLVQILLWRPSDWDTIEAVLR